MTKKDYIIIAKILNFHYLHYANERTTIDLVAQDLAHEMAKDNKRFLFGKFMEAVKKLY